MIGIINVPHNQEQDLLRHWIGPTDQPRTLPQPKAAAFKLGAMPKAMILRGC